MQIGRQLARLEHHHRFAALRQCMRSVGSKLSKRCVNALVVAGEVSQTEVNRRKTRVSTAK